MTLIADIRLRLVGAVLVVIALSQLQSIAFAAGTLVFAVLLALASEMPPQLWRRLLHVEGLVLLLFLTLPFAVTGTEVFALGPLTASAEGLLRAALVASKISAALIVVMTLLGGIEPTRIGSALQALGLPEPVVRLFLMTVRYLAVIRAEALRLNDAMRARAFRPRSNRHTWRSYGYLIGMLLVRALDRAHRIEEAMRCRGFSGRFAHTALPPPLARDWIGFALLAGAAALLLLGTVS